MTYILIIMHSIRLKLKDYKLLFIMTVFPIFLTAIFAFIFEQAYGEQIIEETIGIHIVQGETTLGEDYLQFLEAAQQDKIKISYRMVTEKEANIVVEEEANRITIQKKKDNDLVQGAIKQLNEAFARSVGMQKLIEQQVGVGNINKIPDKDTNNLMVVEQPFDKQVQGVVEKMILGMLVFAIALGGQFAMEQVFYLNEPVGRRIYTTPVRRVGVYISEFLACFFVSFVVASIVTGVYECFFRLGLSKYIGQTIFVVAYTVMIATLIGVAVGLCVKTKNMGENIYSFLMTAMVILSGGLIPQLSFGKLAYMSPVKPCVDGFNQIVQGGKIENGMHFFIVVTTLLIGIVGLVYSMQRKGRQSNVK